MFVYSLLYTICYIQFSVCSYWLTTGITANLLSKCLIMKKILCAVALTVSVACLFSCRKDNQPPESVTAPPSGDTAHHTVRMNVSSFEAQYTNMRLVSLQNDSARYLNYLFAGIYDASGRLVSWREQQRGWQGDTAFGKFNWALTSGTYSVVFVATTDTLVGKYYLLNNKADSLAGLRIQNYWTNGGVDVFYNKSTFTVGNMDTVVNSIQLSRISGKIEVHLKDNSQLLDSTSMTVTIKGYPAFYAVGGNFYSPASPGDSLTLKKVSSRVYEGFCLGSSNKINTAFRGFLYKPGVGQQFFTKVLNNVDVYIYPNKRTVLSGYLAGAESGTINLSADAAFSETILTNF